MTIWQITIDIEGPITPISGNGPIPRVNKNDRMICNTLPNVIAFAGV